MRQLRIVLLVSLFASFMSHAGTDFPRPKELQVDVDFWVRIYSQVDTNSGLIHDAWNLGAVYEEIDLPTPAISKVREHRVRQAVERYRHALYQLGSGKRSNLTATERVALKAWPPGTSNARFRQAAEDLRFQLGQSDRFKAGLIRSGLWRDHIRRTLAEFGLPAELDVLPHVESSFNPGAYSRVAAAGMWQFMPGTAKAYMRVDHIVDERLDPFESTRGAARHLKLNYATLGTWPLALTAYNHGAGGMKRAAEAMATKDIATLVRKYRGPSFGFASRNFYVSFLAALEVDRNAGKYFGSVSLAKPVDYDIAEVPDYMPADQVAALLGTTAAGLREHNPALLDTVWRGEKWVPRGYRLRFPRAQLPGSLAGLFANAPSGARFAYQKPDVMHRIAAGDTLSGIANRYGVSVKELMALNGLRNHLIRAGQTLRLPGKVGAVSERAVASVPAATQTGVYIVQSGDSIWGIAKRFNLTQAQLLAANDDLSRKKALHPGDRLRLPAGLEGRGVETYVIRPGDSLWAIARRFNLTEKQLLSWNDLDDKHVIVPGDRLRVASAD